MKSLVLLCIFGLALAEGKKCGENQHYESCGTACPLTCDNYNDPPKACVLMCNPGCHCDEGYVKTKDGRCVKPENCPAKTVEDVCGENQHYESCGTSCPLTCGNWMNPPKICNLMCNSGCFCNKGYVQTDDGRCVRPETCPANGMFDIDALCGEYKHYENCGTMCPLTCDNYNDPPKACVLMCKPGCQCDKGYVKTKDGKCVRPANCPANGMFDIDALCGENKHYENCGTMCPLTCDNYNDPPKACVLMCKPGCQCDKGYVKTKDGKCVRPESCPANGMFDIDALCGEYKHYENCGTMCPLTCDNYNDPPKACVLMCKPGCQCDKGYVKTKDGKCVRPANCPANTGVESDSCDLPAETGVCRGFFPRYYFDRTTGQCQKFVYGGCGGNENNFETVEECQNQCGVKASRDICKLPQETGHCLALFSRYYYNSETGKCQRFFYGGCGGNENNFKTQEACEETCGSS